MSTTRERHLWTISGKRRRSFCVDGFSMRTAVVSSQTYIPSMEGANDISPKLITNQPRYFLNTTAYPQAIQDALVRDTTS